MKTLSQTLSQSLRLFLVMTVLLGLLYPAIVTLVGGALFADKAGGSLIKKDGKVIGSSLIAQKFENARYFHPRPSAGDFNPLPSGGTNLGPTSKKLQNTVTAAKATLGENAPKEMLYASGSGLDPHISPEAAVFQIERVATARGFDQQKRAQLTALVNQMTRARDLGFLGEPTVNVLNLNLEVDKM